MDKIRFALVGVGNCASSLVQGVIITRSAGRPGPDARAVGGYAIADIEFVAAFDTDARKVGLDLVEAIFAGPNCTPCSRARSRIPA